MFPHVPGEAALCSSWTHPCHRVSLPALPLEDLEGAALQWGQARVAREGLCGWCGGKRGDHALLGQKLEFFST